MVTSRVLCLLTTTVFLSLPSASSYACGRRCHATTPPPVVVPAKGVQQVVQQVAQQAAQQMSKGAYQTGVQYLDPAVYPASWNGASYGFQWDGRRWTRSSL